MRFPVSDFEADASDGWTPPAQLNPWQWAERNIEFTTRVSPIRGPVQTDMVPYVRFPLECYADPTVRRITLSWAAQTTKTTTLALMLCYSIDNDPKNALFVRPSLTAAKSFAEGKLIPIINHNPALAKHKTADRYDLMKTQLQLDLMTIFVRGANPNQLAAESCGTVELDETDKFDTYAELHSEADLVSLAFERLKFYRNSKGIMASTPTIPSGIIWRNLQEGDQRLFEVPCLRCGAQFPIEWENVRWPKEADGYAEIRANTWVECPSCKAQLMERDKYEMGLRGVWVPRMPGEGDHISLRLPEMYSPVTKWGDLAVKFLKAKDQAKVGFLGPLHNFINSSLAQPWNPEENKSRDEKQIRILMETRPPATLPDRGVLGITFFIDTQDIGFWFLAQAFGVDLESWLVLEGYAENFADVRRQIIDREFSGVRPCFGLMDSGGHRTSEVYDICRRIPFMRASKGQQRMSKPFRLEKQDQYPNGQPIPGGVVLALINTTYYKDMVAAKIALPPGTAGGFHVHGSPTSHYVSHMSAEYRNERGVWVCPSHKRNDLWDCTVGTFAAADMIGLRWWQKKRPAVPTPAAAKVEEEEENPWTAGILKK